MTDDERKVLNDLLDKVQAVPQPDYDRVSGEKCTNQTIKELIKMDVMLEIVNDTLGELLCQKKN